MKKRFWPFFAFLAVLAVVGALLLRFIFFKEEQTLARDSIEELGFRLSAEVTRVSKLGRDDYRVDISIVYLKENFAILYHAPPPYSLYLTALDTGEKIDTFAHPSIEERTLLSPTHVYFGESSLPEEIPPGNYEVTVSGFFDFLETEVDPYASLDALKELDKQERQHFSNSISLFISIE